MNGGAIYGITFDNPINCVVRNCAVGYVRSVTTAATTTTAVGIHAEDTSGTTSLEVYNNVVHSLTATAATAATAAAYGVWLVNLDSAKTINNAVGTLTADDTTNSFFLNGIGTDINSHNAGTGTVSGTGSVSNIVPADTFENYADATMDLHLKAGAPGAVASAGSNPLRQAGLNLRQIGLYINSPTRDIDGDSRDLNLPWNIGADDDVVIQTKSTGTGFDCENVDGSFSKTQWRLFYPNCRKINSLCNSLGGAYVDAATVCRQQLYDNTSS